MSSLSNDAFDTAQMCRNGHVITLSAVDFPEYREDRCHQCGAPAMMACEHCGAPIRGASRRGGSSDENDRRDWKYCTSCGEPHPWTVQALNEANTLIDELALDDEDKANFKDAVLNLTNNTGLELAGSRWRNLIAKVGPQTGLALKDILVRVLSDAALKQMGIG